MENKFKRYTVTSALPYANGPLHIGHIAGAYLPADIYVRYLRLKQKDVIFVCGSDEHGAAITIRAKKEGVSPKSIIDKYNEINKKAFADFGISFDIYHRTSSDLHHKTAQDFFVTLEKNGSFIKKTSEQYFDEENNQFLADRYITGTCPKCGYEKAYGDQCEKCGSALSPTDLINPKSAISGKSPVLKETSHWYLPMQNHEKWLKTWINKGELNGKKVHDPKTWRNQVVGQCNSWIDSGLHERAMTRDLDWGVKVPVKDADGKVLYVWLDAPIGYISATKALLEKSDKKWEDYWKNDSTKLVHFIGKDNIVFHAIIFPILLKEHKGYILPENVPANAFLNLENDKLSTSRNWAVWLHEYINDFKDKQDVLRYVLTSIAPETKDSEFTWKDFQERNNNELVAILGNFINRTIVLTNKYYNGIVPEPEPQEFLEFDKKIIDQVSAIKEKVENLIENYHFRDAQKEAMNIARLGNKYLAETEPWKLIKTNPERVKNIIFISLQITSALSNIFEPFLPFTAKKIRKLLNIKNCSWESIGKCNEIKAGDKISKASLLFDKIENEEVENQVNKLLEAKKSNEIENAQVNIQKANINFDDFSKLDIRIGTIIEAEKLAKTKKLLKLLIDTGIDKRTVISGIAEHYNPENIIGKQVSILINLEPRKIQGVESQGMILMAENANGELAFVSPDKKIYNGGEVK